MSNRASLIILMICSLATFVALDRLLPFPLVSMALLGILILGLFYIVGFAGMQFGERSRAGSASVTPVRPMGSGRSAGWQPFVNILIPAKNEARVIESCIRNIFKLDYPDFDVWLIDDNSSDDTLNVARSLQKEFPDLRVLHRPAEERHGKSAALNAALKYCVGDVVAVFDADAFVAPDFLRLMLPALEAESIGAIQAQKRIILHDSDIVVRCQDAEYAFDTFLQTGRDRLGGAVELRGNGQLVKRSALARVGGWNEDSITDDLDLSSRLLIAGLALKFVPEAIVWEEGVPGIKALMAQRKRWAEGSIRRYLDCAPQFVTSEHIPHRLRIEVLAFLSEFAVPPLMLMCLVRELAFAGNQSLLMAAISALMIVSTWAAIFSGVRLFRTELSLPSATILSIATNIYLYVLWCPCVFWSFGQILLRRKASRWICTEHYGAAEMVMQERRPAPREFEGHLTRTG